MNDAPDTFEITDLDGDHLTVALRYDGAIRITINFRELMLLEPGEARALADWLHAATEPQSADVPDLVGALRASVEAAEARRGEAAQ